jgi:ribonuclease T1
MKSTFWNHLGLTSAILLTIYLVVNLTGCSFSTLDHTPNYSKTEQGTPARSITSSPSQVNSHVIGINDLPSEARKTLQLIENGGPFPYPKDGSVFSNYERLLPDKPAGYYHEYTVITPGSADRGARRIVAGSNGEYYYTDDHYYTFKLVVE